MALDIWLERKKVCKRAVIISHYLFQPPALISSECVGQCAKEMQVCFRDKDRGYAFCFKRYETKSVADARYELDLIPGLLKCFVSIEN